MLGWGRAVGAVLAIILGMAVGIGLALGWLYDARAQQTAPANANAQPQSTATAFDVALGRFITTLYNENTRVGRLLPRIFAEHLSEDKRKIWFAGEGGMILSSVDEGKSWRHVWTGTHQDLKAVYVLNPKSTPLSYTGPNGFAIGDYGQIVVSRDWGVSWKLGPILVPDVGEITSPIHRVVLDKCHGTSSQSDIPLERKICWVARGKSVMDLLSGIFNIEYYTEWYLKIEMNKPIDIWNSIIGDVDAKTKNLVSAGYDMNDNYKEKYMTMSSIKFLNNNNSIVKIKDNDDGNVSFNEQCNDFNFVEYNYDWKIKTVKICESSDKIQILCREDQNIDHQISFQEDDVQSVMLRLDGVRKIIKNNNDYESVWSKFDSNKFQYNCIGGSYPWDNRVWLVGADILTVVNENGRVVQNPVHGQQKEHASRFRFVDGENQASPPLGNLRSVAVSNDAKEARIVGDDGVFYRTQKHAAHVVLIATHVDANFDSVTYDARNRAGVISGNRKGEGGQSDGPRITLYFQEASGLPKLVDLEKLTCRDFRTPQRRWEQWGKATVAKARAVKAVCDERRKHRGRSKQANASSR